MNVEKNITILIGKKVIIATLFNIFFTLQIIASEWAIKSILQEQECKKIKTKIKKLEDHLDDLHFLLELNSKLSTCEMPSADESETDESKSTEINEVKNRVMELQKRFSQNFEKTKETIKLYFIIQCHKNFISKDTEEDLEKFKILIQDLSCINCQFFFKIIKEIIITSTFKEDQKLTLFRIITKEQSVLLDKFNNDILIAKQELMYKNKDTISINAAIDKANLLVFEMKKNCQKEFQNMYDPIIRRYKFAIVGLVFLLLLVSYT